MSAPASALEAMHGALAFQPQGERVGNVSWGRGTLDAKPVRVAQVENRFAGGSIGALEAERLGALFKVVARERSALVLYIDSAGAKVSEGLKALGAFRSVYRAGLEAAASGASIVAVLGGHCYGGSSMLAHLAGARLFSPHTQLAMSGPAILAAAAGASAIDEMFRAMAQAALSGASRSRSSPANTVWVAGGDMGAWLREALGAPAPDFRARHEALAMRLAKPVLPPAWEATKRRELERIYAEGCEAREGHGLLEGQGRRDGRPEALVGLVGNQPLGAERAWHFAECVWQHAAAPPAHLEVFLDCASHAARLDDERLVLSEFIADMSMALWSLAARGTHIGLTITGRAGGGVYVALAAPAQRVASVHGAEIQVLPGAAVAAILGESSDAVPGFDDYRAAGVADEELRLGLVP